MDCSIRNRAKMSSLKKLDRTQVEYFNKWDQHDFKRPKAKQYPESRVQFTQLGPRPSDFIIRPDWVSEDNDTTAAFRGRPHPPCSYEFPGARQWPQPLTERNHVSLLAREMTRRDAETAERSARICSDAEGALGRVVPVMAYPTPEIGAASGALSTGVNVGSDARPLSRAPPPPAGLMAPPSRASGGALGYGGPLSSRGRISTLNSSYESYVDSLQPSSYRGSGWHPAMLRAAPFSRHLTPGTPYGSSAT